MDLMLFMIIAVATGCVLVGGVIGFCLGIDWERQ